MKKNSVEMHTVVGFIFAPVKKSSSFASIPNIDAVDKLSERPVEDFVVTDFLAAVFCNRSKLIIHSSKLQKDLIE